MTVEFYKYHGTGNDFVLIDNRSLFFDKNNTELISKICSMTNMIHAGSFIGNFILPLPLLITLLIRA